MSNITKHFINKKASKLLGIDYIEYFTHLYEIDRELFYNTLEKSDISLDYKSEIIDKVKQSAIKNKSKFDEIYESSNIISNKIYYTYEFRFLLNDKKEPSRKEIESVFNNSGYNLRFIQINRVDIYTLKVNIMTYNKMSFLELHELNEKLESLNEVLVSNIES